MKTCLKLINNNKPKKKTNQLSTSNYAVTHFSYQNANIIQGQEKMLKTKFANQDKKKKLTRQSIQ